MHVLTDTLALTSSRGNSIGRVTVQNYKGRNCILHVLLKTLRLSLYILLNDEARTQVLLRLFVPTYRIAHWIKIGRHIIWETSENWGGGWGGVGLGGLGVEVGDLVTLFRRNCLWIILLFFTGIQKLNICTVVLCFFVESYEWKQNMTAVKDVYFRCIRYIHRLV